MFTRKEEMNLTSHTQNHTDPPDTKLESNFSPEKILKVGVVATPINKPRVCPASKPSLLISLHLNHVYCTRD